MLAGILVDGGSTVGRFQHPGSKRIGIIPIARPSWSTGMSEMKPKTRCNNYIPFPTARAACLGPHRYALTRIEDLGITGVFPAKIMSDSQFSPYSGGFSIPEKRPIFRWKLRKCPDFPEKSLIAVKIRSLVPPVVSRPTS